MPEVHLVRLGASDREGGGLAAVAMARFPCVVGRHSACDHRIKDPRVSRRHCAFFLRDGRAWVEDLGSLNGTRLNGVPLNSACPVADGDRLDLADLPFRVRLPGHPVGAAEEQGAVADAKGPAGPPRQVLMVEDDEDAARTPALLPKALRA